MTNIYGLNDKLSTCFLNNRGIWPSGMFPSSFITVIFCGFSKKKHIKNDLTIGKIFRNFQRIPLRI